MKYICIHIEIYWPFGHIHGAGLDYYHDCSKLDHDIWAETNGKFTKIKNNTEYNTWRLPGLWFEKSVKNKKITKTEILKYFLFRQWMCMRRATLTTEKWQTGHGIIGRARHIVIFSKHVSFKQFVWTVIRKPWKSKSITDRTEYFVRRPTFHAPM